MVARELLLLACERAAALVDHMLLEDPHPEVDPPVLDAPAAATAAAAAAALCEGAEVGVGEVQALLWATGSRCVS